jgi:hypothetical protein
MSRDNLPVNVTEAYKEFAYLQVLMAFFVLQMCILQASCFQIWFTNLENFRHGYCTSEMALENDWIARAVYTTVRLFQICKESLCIREIVIQGVPFKMQAE